MEEREERKEEREDRKEERRERGGREHLFKFVATPTSVCNYVVSFLKLKGVEMKMVIAIGRF
jgi:hypothetical protein